MCNGPTNALIYNKTLIQMSHIKTFKSTPTFSLFHRAFQFTMCNGPTNALIYDKTLIQMSHIKILKTTPTCFDHKLIIIRELI
jgi:hypothetical protein